MKKMLQFRRSSLSLSAFIAKVSVVLLLACTFSVQLNAQAINPKISIQGTLKSANGSSVADGSYAVRFNLYNVESGGVALWFEDAMVDVVGGIYSHYLGSVTPLNAQDFATTLFLGVKVGSYELIPRSELAYSPYAFSVSAAQTVVCSGAVGDVKYSILNPTQFDAENGDCWVPMDGRALATTDKLRIITGRTTVPDGGGLFLRAQEFSGGADNDPSRNSGSPIATVQAQAVQSHNHGVTDPGHGHSFNDTYHTNRGAVCGCAGQGDAASNSTTSEVDNTNNSTTGISVNAAGGPETRPVNMNLWIYIRIN